MQCSNCGRVNPATAVYCLDCGHKLRETANVPASPVGPFAPAAAAPSLERCGRCGVDNPPAVRFCRMCGFELRAPAEVPVVAPPQPAPPVPAVALVVPLGPPPPAMPPPGAPVPVGLAPVAPVLPPTPVVVPAAPPEPVAGPVSCPRCGSAFDRSMSFCGVCGLPASEIVASARPAVAAAAVAVVAPAVVPAAPAAPAVVVASGAEPRGAEARTDNFGAVAAQAGPQLVTILKDGSEGPVHRLTGAVTDIGRYEGSITLSDDPYLSPRHARLQRRGDRFYLRDLGSVNGIFLRLREPMELQHGDVVLVGQQVLKLELLADAEVSLGPVMHYGVMLFGTPEQPRVARLVQLTSEGVPRDVYHLYRDETVIGRESGDLVFTDDVFLSRRHVAVRVDRAHRRVHVRDLGSSNGTLVLFRGEREIADGDVFRIGHHLFRFDGSPRGGSSGVSPGNAGR